MVGPSLVMMKKERIQIADVKVVDMLFPSNTFLFLHYAQQQRESRGVKVGINYSQ
jgi:hypothetical protein